MPLSPPSTRPLSLSRPLCTHTRAHTHTHRTARRGRRGPVRPPAPQRTRATRATRAAHGRGQRIQQAVRELGESSRLIQTGAHRTPTPRKTLLWWRSLNCSITPFDPLARHTPTPLASLIPPSRLFPLSFTLAHTRTVLHVRACVYGAHQYIQTRCTNLVRRAPFPSPCPPGAFIFHFRSSAHTYTRASAAVHTHTHRSPPPTHTHTLQAHG